MAGQSDPSQIRMLELADLTAISLIGRGAKGVVFYVHAPFNKNLALKVISKSSIEHKNSQNIYRRICFERDVLHTLQHPLFPSLHGVISTQKIIGFALNYCPGGDLNSLRMRQTEKMFSDGVIRFYAAEMVLALQYLHGLRIVYRDLKPENILIQENGHIMLVDFDLSTKLPPSKSSPEIPCSEPDSVQNKKNFSLFRCFAGISDVSNIVSTHSQESGKSKNYSVRCPDVRTPNGSTPRVHPAIRTHQDTAPNNFSGKSNSFVGTEDYVAPEIIEGKGHDVAVDWWSLGVVLYEMLYGRTPFRGSNRKETFYRILAKSPEIYGEKTAVKDLIGRLLEKDPAKRIAGEEIRRHEFFQGVDWESLPEIARPPFIPTAAERKEEGEGLDIEKTVEEILLIPRVGNGKVLEGNHVAEVRNSSRNDDFELF